MPCATCSPTEFVWMIDPVPDAVLARHRSDLIAFGQGSIAVTSTRFARTLSDEGAVWVEG